VTDDAIRPLTEELEDHLEVVITDDDVDDKWQLPDLEALMRPHRAEVRRMDAQMVEALEDTQ
jgi:hypothetical protein